MNLSAKLTAHRALLSTFSAIVGAAVVQLLTQLVFARELGPNSVGLYFIAIAAHRVVEAISPLGFPMALTREVSTFKSSGAWPSARRLTSRTTLYCCMLGAIGALLVIMLTYLAGAFLSLEPEAQLAMRIVALAGPPACMGLALAGTLKGLGKPIWATVAGPLVSSSICLASFLLLFSQWGYGGAVAAFVLGQYVACITLAVGTIAAMSRRDGPQPTSRPIIKSALAYWLFGLAALGNDSIGALLLGLCSTVSEAGLFGLSTRLALPLMFLSFAIQAVYEPRFAATFSTRSFKKLEKEYYEARLISIISSIIIFSILCTMSKYIFIFFGGEFSNSRSIYIIILLGCTISSSMTPAGSLLAMTGHAPLNARLALAVLTITLPVMYILVLHFGGIGAAIATSTALSARAIMQFVAAERSLGVAAQP